MDILPIVVFFACMAGLLTFRYLAAGSRRQQQGLPLKVGKPRDAESQSEPVVIFSKITRAGGSQAAPGSAPDLTPHAPSRESTGEFTRMFGSQAAQAPPVSQPGDDTLIAAGAPPFPVRPVPAPSPPPAAMASPEPSAKSSFRELHRPVMAVVVTLVVMGLCMYAIVSQQYDEDGRRWAYGTLGMIIGYWLKP